MQSRGVAYHSQGLVRGLTVLRALGRSRDPMTLATLSDHLDIAKSTLLRLLSVMEQEGFVVKIGDTPSYGLGPSVFEVAESVGSVDLSAVTSTSLKRLADDLGFTTNLGVLQGRSVLHLAVEEPDRALRIAAGGYLDHVYCTALGKILLSELPTSEIDQHLPVSERWDAFTDHTITRRDDFLVELERISRHGYSIDDQERNRGVRCMAVLVPTKAGFGLALSASGPVGELADAAAPRVLNALTAAATDIAQLPRIEVALDAVRSRWGIE